MKYFEILFLLIVYSKLIWGRNKNIVCKTVEAYFDKVDENPNCWFDSDVTATPEELAEKYGVKLERYVVRTKDGYLLTTFRLKSNNGLYGKEVVFLQHGLGGDALSFMANENRSIAFFLAKQGFDVWLGNYRGTDFSKHESLLRDNPKFWDFSFHEHGIYDLSANFKYINNNTKKQIIYIGHSMGTTGFGVYSSMKPIESKKFIMHAILLTPAFYMRNSKRLIDFITTQNIYRVLMLAPTMNLNVIMATNSFEKQAIEQLCLSSLENAYFCLNLVETAVGKSENGIPPEKIPIGLKLLRNAPIKCALHYIQLIHSRDFRMFDFGTQENILRYNSTIPPSYNVSNIVIPLSLVYATHDILIDKEDVISLYKTFGKPNWDIHEIPYNHVDFLLDSKADKQFLPLMLKLVNKYIL